MIGKLLDHYRILSQIGQGGMGVVYRAHDEVLDRDVAVKFLATGAGETVGRDHLLREAQTASSLSHPNICTIYQVGKSGEEYYVVMELVEGQPLPALTGVTGLPFEVLARYGVQIADALAHAHDKGILHRDLKGANILVTREGRVKILDFGLATRAGAELLSEVTRDYAPLSSALVGTLPFMAPETLKGEPATQQSDIWSLGVTLFHAACGDLPFRGNTSFEMSSAILHQPPASLPVSVPPGLTGVILRCLAKEPAQRFQRASEVRAALETLQGATLAGREPVRPESHGPRTMVHRGIEHHTVREGDVLLLVGTTKGAFFLRSSRERKRWDVAGPYFHGHGINAIAYDGREGRHRLWLSTNSVLWGTYLRSSDDFGKMWTNPLEANVKFPEATGTALKNIWQVCLGGPHEPDVLYCGVEPAALFESRDAGENWSLVRGLFDHPHRPRWVPGNGGLMLHTILPGSNGAGRFYAAISAGGVYSSDDSMKTWTARNRGVRVTFMPEKYPEFGQCVHKIAVHPARPERLFLQNHWGVYRSDDAAETWQDVGSGLPSDFGFPVLIHPQDPDCVFILPVESDEFRCTPEGHLRVYRSRNAGASWEPLSRGLPQQRAYETVLRDAMCADELDPTGIYFGTRNGTLFGSRDEGRSWTRILEGLPAIVCVKIAVIGQPRASRAPRPPRPAKKRRKISRAKGRR